MGKTTLILVVVIGLLVAPRIYRGWQTDRLLRQKADASLAHLDITGPAGQNRRGAVAVRGVSRRLTERQLSQLLAREARYPQLVLVWDWNGVRKATASAMGIDRMQHFVNSFLVGYQPFHARHTWEPILTLALRKTYVRDDRQYGGLLDVWQNSRQAFYFPTGDCEDHAILLADWLIAMGLDARVVVGRYRDEGHAWVVFFQDGKTYLIEPTSKKKTRRHGLIPEASRMIHYHPSFQFNRENFWVNTGSTFTTRYSGRQWILKSRFVTS
jgi:hypothetical protein